MPVAVTPLDVLAAAVKTALHRRGLGSARAQRSVTWRTTAAANPPPTHTRLVRCLTSAFEATRHLEAPAAFGRGLSRQAGSLTQPNASDDLCFQGRIRRRQRGAAFSQLISAFSS